MSMKIKICPKCGKAFEPQANRQKYCSPLCARNAETERNMPYIKMRSKIKSKINTELLEAFDRKCAICGWGLSTDISVKKYRHSGGCQFHHIIPIAQGGTNDEENLILLCPNCHALAHAGILTEEALKTHTMNKDEAHRKAQENIWQHMLAAVKLLSDKTDY